MDKIEVSVIIPVYNVELYIDECIKSLISQQCREVEYIFINDGSLDKSMSILKGYSDKRIRIINQKNGGLSAARNTGVKFAKGQYILFIDSDDYLIDNKAIDNMYKIARENNSDIVVSNAVKIYEDRRAVPFYRDKNIFYERTMDSKSFLKEFIKKDSMQVPVWMNLYRRSFLLSNNLFFKEGILHEDELFTPQAFLKADKVSIYKSNFYAYRQRENSIMTSPEKQMKRCIDILNICCDLVDIFSEIKDDELRKELNKKPKWLILNAINTNELTSIPTKLKMFLLKDSEEIKELVRNSIISVNLKLYKKLMQRKIGWYKWDL